MTLGDRGRLVVPAELRAGLGLEAGAALLLVDTPRGVVLLTREQAREMIRADLQGEDLVADLVNERRRAAAAEDAG